jgi:hypothetical protein
MSRTLVPVRSFAQPSPAGRTDTSVRLPQGAHGTRHRQRHSLSGGVSRCHLKADG